ncbi:MAG TPA: hypothetical protein VMU42_10700 [Candidatus Sulfotelmatobacter sp.]|nr:hypothetical protein [Candidatus Sulfotelmatobacter sp.]
MESADYLLCAAAALVAALICFASPVFGWIWRGDWTWPGWTIGSLLHRGRGGNGLQAPAAGAWLAALPEPEPVDPMARYNIGWVFLALALVLLAAAGLDVASLD